MNQRGMRAALVILLLLANTTLGSPARPSAVEPLQVARDIWDSAIEAKCGRDRLYSVRNVVRVTADQVDFWVLPSFYFMSYDMKPSQFGLFIHWFNFERDVGYSLFANELTLEEESPIREGWASRLAIGQLEYLMETKWFRPDPISGFRGKQADTVVVNVDCLGYRYRADVVLNKKTHLPVEIGIYIRPGQTKALLRRFKDYVEVDGIKFPSRVSDPQLGTGWSVPSKFEINAEYDPEFLTKPPDINAGPYQWKAK